MSALATTPDQGPTLADLEAAIPAYWLVDPQATPTSPMPRARRSVEWPVTVEADIGRLASG